MSNDDYKRGREEAWNELRRAAIAHGGVSNTDTGETISFEGLDLSHVGAELHAKWAAEEEDKPITLQEMLLLPDDDNAAPPVREMPKRMSPEHHADFMKWLRQAGASEEIVKSLEKDSAAYPYPLGTEATYENGYAAGHRKGMGVGLTTAMAKISELAMKKYDAMPDGAAVSCDLRELAARLGALV